MDTLQDQVLMISNGAGGARPGSTFSRLREWIELLASIKELGIWLAAALLGGWGLIDPETIKVLGLRLIGAG